MPAIIFPPNPTRLDYTITPWVDPYGSPWIWNQTKLRWRADVVLSDKQPLDADLTAIAALTTTAHGRSLLTSADAAASRAAIGAGTSSMPACLALTGVPVDTVWIGSTLTLVFPGASNNLTFTQLDSGSGISVEFVAVAPGFAPPYAVWNPSSRILRVNVRLGVTDAESVLNAINNTSAGGAFEVTAPEGGAGFVEAVALTPLVGIPAIPAITVIGQSAVVTHSTGFPTEWCAVSLSQWQPRTAGILKHFDGLWYRATLDEFGTAEYNLLPNQ